MSLIDWIEFTPKGDGRGDLVALEGNRNIPFSIRRVYYLTGMGSDTVRGCHAHRRLQQVVICLAGRCRMVVDDGRIKQDAWLDTPNRGLIIRNMIWREMHDFSNDCVVMVLADEYYDETDYIRDYREFIGQVKVGWDDRREP